MKKHILNLATILLSGVGLLTVSCGKDDGGLTARPEPTFPTTAAPTIEAGETYTIDIDPNVNWEISIPTEGETPKWFWIQDGSQKIYSQRGNKGKYSIVIATLDENDYNVDRTCDVTMKMTGSDGQEVKKVIATIKRGKVTRTISIYKSKLENDDFYFNENPALTGLKYEYEETTSSEVTLLWPYARIGYALPILVDANFDWSIIGDIPEWLTDITVSSGKRGVKTEIRLLSDQKKLPAGGAEVTLNFGDKDMTFPLKIKIPSYQELSKTDFTVEVLYNTEGEFFDIKEESFLKGAAHGNVASAKSLQFFLFAEANQGGSVYLSNESSVTKWVSCVDMWDNSATELAQNRRVEISAAPNKGAARKGVVLGVPASVASTTTPAQMVNGNEIADNFKQYIITTLKQLENYGTLSPKNLMNEIKQGGAMFERLPANDPLIAQFSVTGDAYNLAYKTNRAYGAAILMFEKEYTKCEYYDQNFVKQPDQSWLTVDVPDTKYPLNKIIHMAPEKDPASPSTDPVIAWQTVHKGYIVFSDAQGSFAVVRCICDPAYNIPIEDPAFRYPTDAAKDGSTLVKLTSGELYDKYAHHKVPVWHLTYSKKLPTMSAVMNLTPYSVVEDSSWLTYSYAGVYSTIGIKEEYDNVKKNNAIILYSDFGKKNPHLVLVFSIK